MRISSLLFALSRCAELGGTTTAQTDDPMLHMTAKPWILSLLLAALPCAGTLFGAQLPGDAEQTPEALAAAVVRDAESKKIADATQAVLSSQRETEARNAQVVASMKAVESVLKTRVTGIGVGDVLREARRRAPSLSKLKSEVHHRDRMLAEALLDNVRLLERQRLADDKVEIDHLTQQQADLSVYMKALEDSLQSAKDLEKNAALLIDLLDGHLLWLRSAERIDGHWFKDVGTGAMWFVHPEQWTQIGAALQSRAADNPFVTSLVLLALLVLLAMRSRLRKSLLDLGSAVGRVSTDAFSLTLRALIYTLLLSLPIPLALLAAGSLLASSDHPSAAKALSQGLLAAGSVFLLLDFARQMCRRGGLADVHFRWNERARQVLRANLRWLVMVEVPAALIVAACDSLGDDVFRLGLGRLAFIAGSLGLFFFFMLVFHPTRGALSELLARDGWPWKLRKLWYGLLVVSPLALGIAAALGYYYTASEVQSRLFMTGIVVLSGIVCYSMLERSLLVARRRIAMQQARQKLAHAREARAKREDGESHEETASGDAVPDIDLQTIDVSAVSTQTLALVRTLVVIGGMMLMWAVWSQVLPALAVLDNFELTSPKPDLNGDPLVPALTLGSVLAALLTVLLTILAARNLPSMLELAVLTRFHVDSGARYAASTLVRYVVIAIGVLTTSSLLGVDWSKMQWIIAALGVGLGFGLQEIVANFVSGLIILFERPIRVGDTVTVGSDSGTVSRLQIRATTITDWDNKEILVPNKNFITESVVNWTLSSSVTRLIAKVGVAYGTDIVAAREAITGALKSVPTVLENPAPSVFFLGFGDSSLNFEVRAFVDDLSKRLPTLHELNLAINLALAAAKIEIPFPQTDLHVRSDDTLERRLAAARHSEAHAGPQAERGVEREADGA